MTIVSFVSINFISKRKPASSVKRVRLRLRISEQKKRNLEYTTSLDDQV